VLRVTGVDHHHLEPTLFEDFEYRNPINTGRLHDDCLYPAAGEPVRQPVKIVGEGSERPDWFTVAFRANRGDMYCGADINRRRGRMDRDQVSRFTGPLRLSHVLTLLPEKAKEGLGHGERSIS